MGLARATVLLFGLAALARALPAPVWPFPTLPARVVFDPPADVASHVLLRLARTGLPSAGGLDLRATDAAGTPLPVRAIHTGPDACVVLCQLADAARKGPCMVYYGPPDDAAGAPAPDAVADPAPVAAELTPLEGKGVPTSWDRLRFLLWGPRGGHARPTVTPDTQLLRQRIAGFEHAAELRGRGEGGEHGPGVRALILRSFVLCPAAGAYQFAIDCADAGFVTVDGQPAAAWPGEHAAGAWQRGNPIALDAGVHRLDVYVVFDARAPRLRVGWIQPGRTAPEPIGARFLVAACEAVDGREERKARTLQPGFRFAPRHAYAFRNRAAAFVDVAFQNTTRNWIADTTAFRWTFGDGASSTEENPSHVYPSAGRFLATLEARDGLGFTARCARWVDVRQAVPAEVAAAFDIDGVPAACYGHDRVAPRLRIRGATMAGLPDLSLDVTWDVAAHTGDPVRQRAAVALGERTAPIPLCQTRADEVDAVVWRASHAGVAVGEGTVRFVRPPFDVVPARVAGDGLYDKRGRRLVLVAGAETAGVRQAPLPAARTLGQVVCVDDTLAAGGLVEPGGGVTYDQALGRLMTGFCKGVQYVAIGESVPPAEGCAAVLKLAEVPAALRGRADVAVLSIGLRDILNGRDVAAFEREAAALSDLLAGGLNIRVVWVTPPCYPPDPDRFRPYAAAIRRVADARGIPVADLFTAFRCARDNWQAFFRRNPLMLSDAGHRLAAQQVARMIVGE